MKRDLRFDFDPIKDGTWNMAPFHSDYVPPQRKSSPIDPYELMPVYPAYDADPAAPLPKPKTRAVTGLDEFGEGKREMMDLVHQTSDYGLTQSIAPSLQSGIQSRRPRPPQTHPR
ncbi:MAG: hypothetical protein QF512_21005 [Alphaproteobacteria bacterium]|jgi:hypothetical protein|nr:hypothetical protein [Alphaproteobacteria bacterium]